jgi:hypothetical protein
VKNGKCPRGGSSVHNALANGTAAGAIEIPVTPQGEPSAASGIGAQKVVDHVFYSRGGHHKNPSTPRPSGSTACSRTVKVPIAPLSYDSVGEGLSHVAGPTFEVVESGWGLGGSRDRRPGLSKDQRDQHE